MNDGMKGAAGWVLYSVAALVILAGGIAIGYFFFANKKVTVTVTEMKYVTNWATKYVAVNPDDYTDAGCADLARQYNNLNSNYTRYVTGTPRYVTNDGSCVDFDIADSRYRMCYSTARPADWYADIGAGWMAGGGLAIVAGGGWEFLRAGVIATLGRPDIGGFVSYRHRF